MAQFKIFAIPFTQELYNQKWKNNSCYIHERKRMFVLLKRVHQSANMDRKLAYQWSELSMMMDY